MSVPTSVTLDATTAPPVPAVRPRRAWAVAGAVAGLTGIALFQLNPELTNVDRSLIADNAGYVAAMDGELYWDLLHLSETDPDAVAALATGYGTFGWVWAGAGLSAGAVGVAGLRRRSVSRWLAGFSLLMTLLIVATQVVPLQYLALAPAALWATVAGLTFALERRGLGN